MRPAATLYASRRSDPCLRPDSKRRAPHWGSSRVLLARPRPRLRSWTCDCSFGTWDPEVPAVLLPVTSAHELAHGHEHAGEPLEALGVDLTARVGGQLELVKG